MLLLWLKTDDLHAVVDYSADITDDRVVDDVINGNIGDFGSKNDADDANLQKHECSADDDVDLVGNGNINLLHDPQR